MTPNDDINARLRSVLHELTEVLCPNDIGIKLMLAADETVQRRISDAFPQGPHENSVAMWAHAHYGGLAIAEHIIKHAADFAGKTVLDLGTGCGIAALAAARAGAKRVIATDSSPFALRMTAINAELNGLTVQTALADFMKDEDLMSFYDQAEIITAADVTLPDYTKPDWTFDDSMQGIFTRARRLQEFVDAGKTIYFASQNINYRFAFPTEGTIIEDLDPAFRTGTSFAKVTRQSRDFV